MVLISLDTLRADHLELYGYSRPTAPHLTELAGEAVVFDHAVAQSAHTSASHHSLYTSQYPTLADPDDPHLVELFRDAGYRTAGITGGGKLSARFGFDRGFDEYREIRFGFRESIQTIEEWLAVDRGNEPYFLFLHTYGMHTPYTPSAPFDRMFTGDYAGSVKPEETGDLLASIVEGEPTRQLEEADRDYIVALYDGAIRETDQYLGRIFEALDESPSWDWQRDVVVLFSDHGEEFWDHGSVLHGRTLYEELIHVPLILRLPGGSPRGRVPETVMLIDIAPTLLGLANLDRPAAFLGRDLVPLIRRDPAVPATFQHAISLTTGGWRSVQLQSKKYIMSRPQETEMLFDLDEDPGETRTLHESEPEIAADLRRLLRRQLADGADQSLMVEEADIQDEELREELRALGYLQ